MTGLARTAIRRSEQSARWHPGRPLVVLALAASAAGGAAEPATGEGFRRSPAEPFLMKLLGKKFHFILLKSQVPRSIISTPKNVMAPTSAQRGNVFSPKSAPLTPSTE